jgi:hypothetical protein
MASVDPSSRGDAELLERLRATERARLRALVEGDLATADALHADDYQLVTPGGATLSKAEYLGGIADGTLRYRRFEPDGPIEVRVWGSAAAARYQVVIDVEADGSSYHDRCWHTDIYELRDGRWQAVWSHATRMRTS